MSTRAFLVRNPGGFNVRPVAKFVELAMTHPGPVEVRRANDASDGKNVMGLLMLAAGPGAELTVSVSGSGAEEFLDRVDQLFSEGFGET